MRCRAPCALASAAGYPYSHVSGAMRSQGAAAHRSARLRRWVKSRWTSTGATRTARSTRDPPPHIAGSRHGKAVIKLWNESRTNRARIADSIAVGIRSRRLRPPSTQGPAHSWTWGASLGCGRYFRQRHPVVRIDPVNLVGGRLWDARGPVDDPVWAGTAPAAARRVLHRRGHPRRRVGLR